MSTRAAITSSAATHALNDTSETFRNAEGSSCTPPTVDQVCSEFRTTIASSTVATPMSSPAMNTNGATLATISRILDFFGVSPFALPSVEPEFPANNPDATVASQPPTADIDVHGCRRVIQPTNSGP